MNANLVSAVALAVETKRAYSKQVAQQKKESVYIKRQRVATEALYYLAQANNIELVEDVVAEPKRVRMDYGRGMIHGEFSYVIFSKDGKHLLLWNMVDGSSRILSEHSKNVFGKDIIVDDISAVINYGKGLYSGLKMGDAYSLTRWYVLEPMLVAGNLFDAQRKRTKLLRGYAEKAGLRCSNYDRAKLAVIGEKNGWSYRCHGEDGEAFVVEELNSDDFSIETGKVSLWVLQQRVGDRKIREFALQNGWRVMSEKPFLTTALGYTAWASYGIGPDGKDGFIFCGVQYGDVVSQPYQLWSGDNYSDLQKGNKQFDVEIAGLRFHAVNWWEFELTKDAREEDDDE